MAESLELLRPHLDAAGSGEQAGVTLLQLLRLAIQALLGLIETPAVRLHNSEATPVALLPGFQLLLIALAIELLVLLAEALLTGLIPDRSWRRRHRLRRPQRRQICLGPPQLRQPLQQLSTPLLTLAQGQLLTPPRLADSGTGGLGARP